MDMKKARVLIVDDSKFFVKKLKKAIHDQGYELAGTASTGEEAIEKVKKLNPDIVLMDILLNGPVDGTVAAHFISKN